MANHLTPEELSKELGIDRQEVIRVCVEEGVPIYQGKIDKTLFQAPLEARQTYAPAHAGYESRSSKRLSSLTKRPTGSSVPSPRRRSSSAPPGGRRPAPPARAPASRSPCRRASPPASGAGRCGTG